jgi:PPOX class probable F420-dependent enzyme
VTADVLPDPATAFGKRARRRLRDEQVIWFTTVAADGTPQPNPVWFWWDGETEILVFNRPDARRLANIRERPQVSLHLDGNGRGGDVVVVRGTASVEDDPVPAYRVEGYAKKYRQGMVRVSGSPEAFSEDYRVVTRIRVTRIRGF